MLKKVLVATLPLSFAIDSKAALAFVADRHLHPSI